MNKKTKTICSIGIGIALYIILSLCIQVPIFENYYLCLGYIVLLLYCRLYGSIVGSIVGGIGCILHCFIINGLRGMPGWCLGNIFIGIVLGVWFNKTKNIKRKELQLPINIINILLIILSVAIGILVIKSFTEVILYSQPFLIRVSNNIFAFIADIFVLIIAMPICKFVEPKLKKYI